ncbi:flavin reductase family protein [Rhodococcus koreensis]
MSDIAWNNEFYDTSAWSDAADRGDAGNVLDPREFRNAVGSFATGVVAITYESGGRNYGITANSFTSVSLDPPLVLLSLTRASRALHYLLERPFAVNVLSSDQLDIALHFAGKPRAEDIDWVHDRGAPRLPRTAATLQCTPWASYDGGDHVLVLGRVLEFRDDTDVRPLIFERGRWTELVSNTVTELESA